MSETVPESAARPVQEIVVVSGLPRSGTSMMMRMLDAGGMPILTDYVRTADEDNPRGYYEFERVKRLRADQSWLPEAVGKAVKIISFLLESLPGGYFYRILFMQRSLPEVLASQRKMLERRGMPVADPGADDRRMTELYLRHLSHTARWLQNRPNMRVMPVGHLDAIADPAAAARRVNAFLGGRLDEAKMAAAVDRDLHRQRHPDGK